MPTPINPYVAGNPVGDSPAFIGRADVLREVVRVLRRPQDNAIVLYGQRRIGKTSILQHLTAQLPKGGNYCAVYFDLQDKAALPLGRVLADLARAIAHVLGQPDPDLGADPETAFRQTWLPATLDTLASTSSLALLLDEFDVLADPKAEQAAAAFFPYLRGLMASDPQRLKFVFVIGRNVNDLANIALSLFKGIPAQRVSLLSGPDTADLARLSQKNETLTWPDDAVARLWQLTHGHPFLTQQLCSHVWERAYDQGPNEPPVVTRADAEAAVPDALEASRNTLEWLWDGLPPAERVVISALAEAGPRAITQDELERLLRESGVRVLIRELQNAPQLLQDWDLIEPAEGGYCFRVELLRQWIITYKPLQCVQEELDHVLPVAENLYQAGVGFYQGGQLDQAASQLRQAISLNPNHVRANELLAEILLVQSRSGEARQLLEQLYEYHPAAARPRLIQALLSLAENTEKYQDRIILYQRILEIDPTHPEAVTKEAETRQEIRRRNLPAKLRQIEVFEGEKRYGRALAVARKLAGEYPGERDWTSDLRRLERKHGLAEMYQRALRALQTGDRQTAQSLLIQIIVLEPQWEEATRYLHLVVTGVDVMKLQAQLTAEEEARQEAEEEIRRLERELLVQRQVIAADHQEKMMDLWSKHARE